MTSKYSLSALVGALMVAASFCCVGSCANAITLNSGDVALYNFNFTGQVPPPPYDSVIVTFAFNGANVLSIATYDFFDGLDGGGAQVDHFVSGVPQLFSQFIFDSGATGVRDGVFSVRVTAAGDPFVIVSTSAVGEFFNGGVASIGGELVTPLPAALPLFATGLGALGLFAWRRKRKQTD